MKLQVKNVEKLYGNGDGIRDINLDIEEGELLTLLGPSGCGKSTILRTLGGFISIDKGQILIDGKEVHNLPPEKRSTAMVFQSYNLWPHMTIFENLAFGLKIKKVPKAEMSKRIENMLKLVGMIDHIKKYPTQLSGGQQQRIAIARALLLEPTVLLLDEPFSALDAKIRVQMREELKQIQQSLNMTVVFVTHDQEEAMAVSDRIVVMNKGVIEQIGSPTEIYDNPTTRYVATFIGEMNFLKNTDGTTLAVRPEDVVINADNADTSIEGIIKTIMILGHYTSISMEVGDTTVHAYVPRLKANKFSINDKVSISFIKYYTYN
ncbi:MAG: ABC transporter [Epulopiscium sp. Nuni2H_MBin003]|nr:MAG: ABC transporter [Epulopiscium sp. Nuni2H_MBin003]